MRLNDDHMQNSSRIRDGLDPCDIRDHVTNSVNPYSIPTTQKIPWKKPGRRKKTKDLEYRAIFLKYHQGIFYELN
jgi:hypothetical protein